MKVKKATAARYIWSKEPRDDPVNAQKLYLLLEYFAPEIG
jgi:hypothetical protein